MSEPGDGAHEKVVAYIEHAVRPGFIAAFVHADDTEPLLGSGLQVPAGSVAPGESAEAAVVREAAEESGLEGLTLLRYLGHDVVRWPGRPPQHRKFFHLSAAGPDRWSHHALHEGGATSRRFDFQWIEVADAPLLAAGQGVFAHLL